MRAILPLALLGLSCVTGSVGAQGTTPSSPVVADVLKLAKAKVDENVIVAYAETAPRGNVNATDLLTLHSNGISSRVLVALLRPNPTEGSPVVTEQAPAEPAPQGVAGSTDAVAATYVTPAVVEPPLVQYVTQPVYVGGGSIYYQEDGWWGIGLGVSYWGWTGWYPWYGFGWYPYYGWGGYYAFCGYYSHGHHHHGDHHDGHHHNGNGHYNNGHSGRSWHSGGQVNRNNSVPTRNVGRSTIAGAGGNQGRGMTAASRTAPGSGSMRAQAPAARGGAGNAPANLSGRNAARPVAGVGRSTVAPSGATAARSQVPSANRQATAMSPVARQGVRPAVTAPSGGNRAVAVPRNAAPSYRSSAPSAMRAPTYARSTVAQPGFQGGVSRPSGSQVSPSFGGGFAAPRSAPAPSSMRGFSGGGGGYAPAPRGSFSGGGAPRGFSGGGGGFSGGGARGFGGGGGGRR